MFKHFLRELSSMRPFRKGMRTNLRHVLGFGMSQDEADKWKLPFQLRFGCLVPSRNIHRKERSGHMEFLQAR